MSNTNSSKSGGIGFTGLLTIVFITLKLCNVIAWSWWWVLSPIWISLGLGLGIIAIVGIIALIAALMSGPKKANAGNYDLRGKVRSLLGRTRR